METMMGWGELRAKAREFEVMMGHETQVAFPTPLHLATIDRRNRGSKWRLSQL
jgi:hypothetical protein